MDLARDIAILMVICMHVTAAWKYGETATFQWHASELWDTVCRSAVPLFFMISGAFYKDAPIKRTLRKIVRFTWTFWVISLIYSLSDMYWNMISGVGGDWHQIIEGVLNYKYHLWYLPAYILILSMAPVLVKVMDVEEVTKYLLGIWILFGIAINTILTAAEGFARFDLFRACINLFSSFFFLSGNHAGYFILGRYLSGTRLPKKIVYATGILATVALYIVTDRYSHYSGYGDNRWMSTLNIFVLMQAIALFVFFQNITITGQFAVVISRLSKYTFGIYLSHVLFLEWGYRLNIFTENGIWKGNLNPMLNIPVRVALIYTVSFICTYMIKKLIKQIWRF